MILYIPPNCNPSSRLLHNSIRNITKIRHAFPLLLVSLRARRTQPYAIPPFLKAFFEIAFFVQIRQLAAVEMRKRVAFNSGNMWTMLSQDEREQIKTKFPELILAESRYISRYFGSMLGLTCIRSVTLFVTLLPVL